MAGSDGIEIVSDKYVRTCNETRHLFAMPKNQNEPKAPGRQRFEPLYVTYGQNELVL